MISSEQVTAVTANEYAVPLECYRAEGPSTTSVLLLPALGVAARFYQSMGAALASRGVNTVLFEQRGYGASTLRAGRHSNWGYREWLEEDMPAALGWMRERFPGTNTVLMGHSLGGHLSTCYAGLHPEEIDRLVLVGCGTPWAGAFQGKTRRQVKLLCRLIPVFNILFGRFPGDWLGFGGRDARQMMNDWRELALTNRYSAKGMDVDFETAIADYPGDVFSICFADDTMAPQRATEFVLDKFSQANIHREVLTTEDLGFETNHFKWARKPDVTATRIADWLDAC